MLLVTLKPPKYLKYERVEEGYHLTFSADEKILVNYARLGPFPGGTKLVNVQGCARYTIREIDRQAYVYAEVGTHIEALNITVCNVCNDGY